MVYILYPLVIMTIFLIKPRTYNRIGSYWNDALSRWRPKVKSGELLYSQILKLRTFSSLTELYRYKFYNELIEELYILASKIGAPLKDNLKIVKKGLAQDLKNERKVYKLKHSAYANFLGASLITWGFSAYTGQILGQSSLVLIIGIILWQLIGIFLFEFISARLKAKLLTPFESIFFRLFSLIGYLKTGHSVSEISKLSKLSLLSEINLKGFDYFIDRLYSAIEMYSKYGQDIEDEIQAIIEEIWEYYERKFLEYRLKLTALKFLVLALFFFVPYLLSTLILLERVIL